MGAVHRYRPNVAAILQTLDGDILIAERSGIPGAWQFPQGGVDEGEDLESALRRELREEVGVAPEHFEILKSQGGYRYEFPEDHQKRLAFEGQEQTYFLCGFTGSDADIVLDGSPEFSRHRWIRPEEFEAAWLPDFKLAVYREVMRDFFDVEI